jgi:hypothetical protein
MSPARFKEGGWDASGSDVRVIQCSSSAHSITRLKRENPLKRLHNC